jgi:hypothetical protein
MAEQHAGPVICETYRPSVWQATTDYSPVRPYWLGRGSAVGGNIPFNRM